MKKIILTAVALVSASLFAFDSKGIDAENPDVLAGFEAGLDVGLGSIEREFKTQGFKQENVETQEFMVVLDATNLSTKNIILLKDFAIRRGLNPVLLTNGALLYKSYFNEADAEELAKYLNGRELKVLADQKRFPKKAFVYRKKANEVFSKAPFAFKKIFDDIAADIKQNTPVVVLTDVAGSNIPNNADTQKQSSVADKIKEPVTTQQEAIKTDKNASVEGSKKTTKTEKKSDKETEKQKIKTKSFKLKSAQAEYYILKKNADTSKGFSDSMLKAGGTVKNQSYKTAKTITTKEGSTYLKVVDKNMYFYESDVSVGD